MCSASNYLLGLSPLRFAPYITGTLAGMAVWSTVYASLGGASRTLLQSGVEPDVLLAGARAVCVHCYLRVICARSQPSALDKHGFFGGDKSGFVQPSFRFGPSVGLQAMRSAGGQC